jgi:hypothetical protein
VYAAANVKTPESTFTLVNVQYGTLTRDVIVTNPGPSSSKQITKNQDTLHPNQTATPIPMSH